MANIQKANLNQNQHLTVRTAHKSVYITAQNCSKQ